MWLRPLGLQGPATLLVGCWGPFPKQGLPLPIST